MHLLRLWWLGICHPARALDEIRSLRTSTFGLAAILVRFVITAITSILALLLLRRKPLFESYLTFLPTDRYYAAEVFFLPVFGLGVWLLGSAGVHVIVRSAKRSSDFDGVLNIVAFGLLVPMPVVWVLDWSSIALGLYGPVWIPLMHSAVSVWEVALFSIGFIRLLKVPTWAGVGLAMAVKGGVYIPLATIFVR